MKILVFAVFLCCVVEMYAIPPHVLEKLPEEVVELIYSYRKICAEKLGLTNEEIDSYVITNNDEKYRCYMQCMLLEARWMTPDGKIHFESILEETHPEIRSYVDDAFAKCREFPEGSETCGRAYAFNLCLSKADPVHYFLP